MKFKYLIVGFENYLFSCCSSLIFHLVFIVDFSSCLTIKYHNYEMWEQIETTLGFISWILGGGNLCCIDDFCFLDTYILGFVPIQELVTFRSYVSYFVFLLIEFQKIHHSFGEIWFGTKGSQQNWYQSLELRFLSIFFEKNFYWNHPW